MTDKQLEALRLADEFEATKSYLGAKAAAELRRLHEEVQQWQEKCNTYMELHDAVVKDSDRLYALNAELVEVLREIMSWEENEEMVWAERAKGAIAKAQGDNND